MKIPTKIIFSTLFAISSSIYGGESCVDCHDDIIKDKPVIHAAAEESCENCHELHKGANPGDIAPPETNPFRLKIQGNDLCFSCHEKARGGNHPIYKHPISGDADPLYPEKTFGCISCHNPHSSKMESLFRYNYSEEETRYKGVSCAVCHWDMFGGLGAKPKTPDWRSGE